MRTFVKARLLSFGYALKGIVTFIADEPHPKIHLVVDAILVGMGFYFALTPTEWCLIVICMALTLCSEAINSALETLTDLVSPQHHILAGKAKDIAAGAVLLSVIFGGIVWGIIFLPKVLALVSVTS